jgi:site-specific recombinase XerD
MTPMREALRDYLQIRRALGFQLKAHGPRLENFIGFLEQKGETRITTELALTWARLPADAHPYTWRQRLGMVRGFARYLVTIDLESEVPSKDLLPARAPRVAPYVYSEAEITALMKAARALNPALQGATYETLIGLLAVTGVRVGEALDLDREDVDLTSGVLCVCGKRNKQREVALDDSTTHALGRYARLRDRRWPKPKTPAFFVSGHGNRVPGSAVRTYFPMLIREVGLEGRGKRARPRPHDLRHTFAVRTLMDGYRDGADINHNLALLCTYLGHVSPASTFWYLEAVPELLALVTPRLDDALGDQS